MPVLKELVLSERLQALADMVTVGNRLCDVGCDHGFLSVYLVGNQICPGALAMDVRTGPLSRAAAHIKEYGLEEYIMTRLSDGLSGFQEGEAESLVCAGMGGKLMSRILSEGGSKAKSFKELILQPQSEIPEFRRYLRRNGFRIVDENILVEDGKFYFLIKACPVTEPIECHNPLFDLFGEKLLVNRHPVLKEFLEYTKENAVQNIRQIEAGLAAKETERGKERRSQIKSDLEQIEEALTFYQV